MVFLNIEIKNEQEYLDKVMETISMQIKEVEANAAKRKEDVIHIRKHFWDDLKINMDTFDDFLETIIGMRHKLGICQLVKVRTNMLMIGCRSLKE